MSVADGAKAPAAEIRAFVVAAESITVARREVDADRAVVLHPRQRAPARLHGAEHALHVFARETLEDVAVRELRVAVQLLPARILVGVAQARMREARRHHRLIEHAVEVVVRLAEA